MPGRREEETGREDEEEEKESRERQVRNEIVQKVVVDIEKKGKGAGRCQANRTKNIWAKCQAELGLLRTLKTKKRTKKKTG